MPKSFFSSRLRALTNTPDCGVFVSQWYILLVPSDVNLLLVHLFQFTGTLTSMHSSRIHST